MLKRELGLTERDIIDIPQLFSLKDSYAEAFFPDMVSAVEGARVISCPWGLAGSWWGESWASRGEALPVRGQTGPEASGAGGALPTSRCVFVCFLHRFRTSPAVVLHWGDLAPRAFWIATTRGELLASSG